MEDLGGSFLGLEPDGVTILLLSQHSQCHCSSKLRQISSEGVAALR